jgi:hypothetical protein
VEQVVGRVLPHRFLGSGHVLGRADDVAEEIAELLELGIVWVDLRGERRPDGQRRRNRGQRAGQRDDGGTRLPESIRPQTDRPDPPS